MQHVNPSLTKTFSDFCESSIRKIFRAGNIICYEKYTSQNLVIFSGIILLSLRFSLYLPAMLHLGLLSPVSKRFTARMDASFAVSYPAVEIESISTGTRAFTGKRTVNIHVHVYCMEHLDSNCRSLDCVAAEAEPFVFSTTGCLARRSRPVRTQ